MTGLSVAKTVAVARMVEACADDVVVGLARAVRAMPGPRAVDLAAMLAAEAEDRALRDRVFVAVAPLFRARVDGVEAPRLPPRVLHRLWKAACAAEPALPPLYDEDEPAEAALIATRLYRAAVGRLRDAPETVWPGGSAEEIDGLAAMLDCAPLIHRALPSLPAWIGRPTEDQTAELRLLFKDGADLAPDGAQRVLEMLFAHIADAPLILRVMVLSSGVAANDEFLRESELAGLVDRLIATTDRRVLGLEDFADAHGVEAARRMAADVAWCADLLDELSVTLKLQPDTYWGKQIAWLRGRISKRIAAWLSGADRRVAAALPTTRSLIVGRMARSAPDLAAEAEGPAVDAALALLTLIGGLRQSAGMFGHEGQRKQVVEALTNRLTTYVEEAIDAVGGDGVDPDRALALIEIAASCLAAIGEAGPARTVRRRANAIRGERDAAQALAREGAIR